MRFAALPNMRTVGTPEERERRRHLAVQRVIEGYTTEGVADFLGVDRSSVSRWLTAFRRHGDAGQAAHPVPGRPAKLSHTQEKIVFRWLAESPTLHGFPTDLWSAPRLAQLIRQDLGVSLDPEYLTVWLRQRRYTPQKPCRVPRERDDDSIALWLAWDWPRIKRETRRRSACLMLLDESGLLMAPLLRRSWAPRGRPPGSKEKANHREKVSVAAGVYLNPRRDKLSLAYQTLVNGFFNNEAVSDFLGAAMRQLRKPLTVVWDRGPMHKGDPIEDLLDDQRGRLTIEPLPSHSPRLMPVEFLWRCLKYCRLCNFAPRDAPQLNEAVVRELNLIAKDQILLRSFFHLSDLPLPRALL
jgi:transposase